MKLGSNDIGSVYIGSTAVNKIYIGSTEVWSAANPLLDDYPGAAAAYSLRLLSSTYSGDSIRVRRASDNAESDIGFFNGQLDTTTLETFCSGTNGFVKTWYDQSGNGYDATQTTASNQPKIYDSVSGVITQGTKPCIYGDGSNDYLEYSTSSFPSTGDITFDIFMVENIASIGIAAASAGISANIYTSDRRSITTLCNESSSNAVRLYGGNVIYNANNRTYRLSNTNYQGGGGAINARVNDSDLTVSSFSNGGLNVQSSTSFTLFSPNIYFTPILLTETYIQEAIFYLSDQSSNRSGIESNINTHYNIY